VANVATNDRVGREELDAFLRTRHKAIVVTRRSDGGDQTSPVTLGIDAQGRLLVSTYPERAKVTNVRREPLVAMCVLSLSAAIATGPVAILYGMGLSQITFRVNLIRAPLLAGLMLVGIPLWGAPGAAWALAITETLLLPLWFMRLRKVLRSLLAMTPSDVVSDAATGPDRVGIP